MHARRYPGVGLFAVTVVGMRDAILLRAYLLSLLCACATLSWCGLICGHCCGHARSHPGVGLFAVTIVGMREAILVWAYLRSLRVLCDIRRHCFGPKCGVVCCEL